jgi:signal transduction histidine kinase
VQSLITEVVQFEQPAAADKHVALRVDMPDEALYLLADPQRLKQVLLNLVANAVTYTLEGGQVCVQLLRERSDGMGYIVIRVQDTGIGIAPEHLPRLTEPFFRVQESSGHGTGLGLSISKEIVALHGGVLSIESKPGEGSTFSVRLRESNG